MERVTDKERGPVNETEIECSIRRRRDLRLKRVVGGKVKERKTE